MNYLVTTAITNAIIATLLGMIVFAVSRCTKKPALIHALWIVVLVKLVSPPIFTIQLPILPDWAASR